MYQDGEVATLPPSKADNVDGMRIDRKNPLNVPTAAKRVKRRRNTTLSVACGEGTEVLMLPDGRRGGSTGPR